jgi:hypothetical protein
MLRLLERVPGAPPRLNLFCVEESEAFRVHVQPTWLPEYLEPFFDRHGEAYPVLLDFEDLARHMRDARVELVQKVTRLGGVELSAEGAGAEALSTWLLTAMASGLRPRASHPEANEPPSAG